MSVILYSTHCPKCMVLEKKLQQANIDFELVEDTAVMQEKGFMSAPMLEVNGNTMDFGDAVKWVNGESVANESCESCKI